MSSTEREPTPTSSGGQRILIVFFGVVMFAVGLIVGNLALPVLFARIADGPPAAPTLIAQQPENTPPPPIATATSIPPTATPPPPASMATATSIPVTVPPVLPTATPSPPTSTPTQAPTPTAVRPTTSVFAPDPSAVAAGTAGLSATGTAALGGTPQVVPPVTATPTGTPTPTATPTTPAFAATDRVNTELPVNFRAGPGTTFAAQGALPPGTLLAATGNAQTVDGVAWREFRLANGTVGWVRAQDVLAVR